MTSSPVERNFVVCGIYLVMALPVLAIACLYYGGVLASERQFHIHKVQ